MAAIRVRDGYLAAQYRRLNPDADTSGRSARSSTPCSARSGTCSRPARPTATSAGTTSPTATPNGKTWRLAQLERLGHHVTLTEGGRGRLSELFLPGRSGTRGRRGPAASIARPACAPAPTQVTPAIAELRERHTSRARASSQSSRANVRAGSPETPAPPEKAARRPIRRTRALRSVAWIAAVSASLLLCHGCRSGTGCDRAVGGRSQLVPAGSDS
jgi:hypothetical protein